MKPINTFNFKKLNGFLIFVVLFVVFVFSFVIVVFQKDVYPPCLKSHKFRSAEAGTGGGGGGVCVM